MAINTKVIKTLPFHERHNYADKLLPNFPVQGNSLAQLSSLSQFQSRGSRAITTVYIGWQGVLWRFGDGKIDSHAGQIAVCQRGTEARWISVNALQPYRLSVLRHYVYTYRMLDATSHFHYLQTKLKALELQFGADVMTCNAGQFDATFREELLELIINITDRMNFLRKITDLAINGGSITDYSDANLWVSCYQLDGQIDEYAHKRQRWIDMQNRPEPVVEPEPEPIVESGEAEVQPQVQEQVHESVA